MLKLSATVATKRAVKKLKNVEKQANFAHVAALTKTAWKVKDAVTEAMDTHLDRPTPFTKRGIRVKRATKRSPVAMVYAAPIQDEYLKFQVHGGSNAGRVPGSGIKLNKYGNLPRKVSNRKNTFTAEINGQRGLWQRYGKKGRRVRLLSHIEKRTYRAGRLPFYEVAGRAVRRHYGPAFRVALGKALRSAR